MKPILILRAGDPAEPVRARHGEFADWIQRAIGASWPHDWRVIDVRTDEPLCDPANASAFVMTGSSSSVTERAPWMLRAEEHLRAIVAAEVPFFGICFGHQLLAQALGGHVAKNPRGREIGTIRVAVTERDGIFDALGTLPCELDANATHVDSVVKLPDGARVLASSPLDPVQSFALGDRARTVQFHPEFDGDVMRSHLAARAHVIEAEGGDAKALASRAKDTPHAESILRSFVARFVTR